MAKKIKKPEPAKQAWQIWQQYPKPDNTRVGAKVSWHYYKDRAAADECAVAAKHNAVIQESKGYDFGYCSPGSIRLIKEDWPEYAGLFEVCLP